MSAHLGPASFDHPSCSRVRQPLRLRYFLLSLAWVLCFLSLVPSHAAAVRLAWDPNSEEDLAGYRCYHGEASRDYSHIIEVTEELCEVTGLEEGVTYYFAVTAFDWDLNESDYSNEVTYSPPCHYVISPMGQFFEASGGTGTLSVAAAPACAWTAVSNVSWAIVTSNASGKGDGSITFSVAPNPDPSERKGTATVADQTFSLTQAGVPQYSLRIEKAGTGGGSITVDPPGTLFPAGTTVKVTAEPDVRSTFVGWSGNRTGTSSTLSLTLDADVSVTATFNLKTYTITASAGSNGSISPQGAIPVTYGESRSFTITPNSFYRVSDVKVDGISQGALTAYTFPGVTGDHTLEASFTPILFTLTVNRAGSGSGSVSSDPPGTTIQAGTSVKLTANPEANSDFSGWSGGVGGTSTSVTFTMTADTAVTATFSIKTHTITASAGSNGSISPRGTITVRHGSNQTFDITPNPCYRVEVVQVDGAAVGAATSYTFQNVTSNHTIQASFVPIRYTLTTSKTGTGSGTVLVDPPGTVFDACTVVTLSAVPDSNSVFSGWSGSASGTSPAVTVTMNGNLGITAAFTLRTYTITATAESHGVISPQGPLILVHGTSQTFVITPEVGYAIAGVWVDGIPVGVVSTYTFTGVTANHSIQASFVVLPPEATVPLTPSGTIPDTTPTYTWRAAPRATSYVLKVTDSNGARIQQSYTLEEVTCPSDSGICSVTPNVELAGGSGSWSIQASNISGNSPWSSSLAFTVTAPGPATLVSPVGNVYTTTPTYTWNAVPGSTRYYLWVNDRLGTRLKQWVTAEEAGCPSEGGVCSVTPAVQLAVGSGRWWIGTWNSAGGGPYSSLNFTVSPPPATTLVSPSGRINTRTPTYVWSAVPASTKYCLWVNDPSGNRINKWYSAEEVGCPSGTGTCSVSPSVELAQGFCKWYVETFGATGYGPWTGPMEFSVP